MWLMLFPRVVADGDLGFCSVGVGGFGRREESRVRNEPRGRTVLLPILLLLGGFGGVGWGFWRGTTVWNCVSDSSYPCLKLAPFLGGYPKIYAYMLYRTMCSTDRERRRCERGSTKM